MRHLLKPAFKAVPLVSMLLIAGCQDGDPPTKWFELAKQGAYSAAISESGRYTSLGSTLHGGSFWDISKNERLYNWNHKAGDYSIIAATAISPDESYAVTANQQDLVLWQLSDGQPQGFWSSPAEILSIDLSMNGDFALLGLADHTVVLFDVKNGGARNVLRHDARVKTVDLSRDGGFALTGSDAYRAKFWDLNSGQLLQEIEFDNVVDTVALSDDGMLAFSSATLNKAIVWDTQTGKEVAVLTSDEKFFAERASYLSARFSKDGNRLLTGTVNGRVQLWDSRTGKELKRWSLQKRDLYGPVDTGVYAVGFGTGGRVYAVGSNGIINEFR